MEDVEGLSGTPSALAAGASITWVDVKGFPLVDLVETVALVEPSGLVAEEVVGSAMVGLVVALVAGLGVVLVVALVMGLEVCSTAGVAPAFLFAHLVAFKK